MKKTFFKKREPFHSHEDIETHFDCVRLPDSRYMVNVHDSNISTNYTSKEGKKHTFVGKEITKGKEKILSDFGVL